LVIDRQIEAAIDVLNTLAIESNNQRMLKAMKKLLVYIMRNQVTYRFDLQSGEMEIKSANSDKLYVCQNSSKIKHCTCETNPNKAMCWHKAAWLLMHILLGRKVGQRTQELIEYFQVFNQEVKADLLVLDLI